MPFDGTVRPLEQQMTDDDGLWREIATREMLVAPDLGGLAPPWHTDADLGRPIEVVTNMSKSRWLGFTGYQPTDDAFFALFGRLRAIACFREACDHKRGKLTHRPPFAAGYPLPASRRLFRHDRPAEMGRERTVRYRRP